MPWPVPLARAVASPTALAAWLPRPDTLTFFNPVLRPLLFVALSTRGRRAFATFLRVIPAVAEPAALVLLLLAFASALGVGLFGPYGLLPPNHDFFGSLPRALDSLLVLLTTANFPDVMLPSYAHSRATALFFVPFLLVVLFLLLNLLLAAVYHNYQRGVEAQDGAKAAARDAALLLAFEQLDVSGNGFVELGHFAALLQRMRRPVLSLFASEEYSALDTALTSQLIQSMLTTEPALPIHGLGLEAFRHCVLALKEAKRRGRASDASLDDGIIDAYTNSDAAGVSAGELGGSCTGIARPVPPAALPQERLRRLMHGRAAESLLTALLLANGAVLMAEVHLSTDKATADHMWLLEELTAPVFAAAFLIELALKLCGDGCRRFAASAASVFDGVVTLLSVTADVVVLATPRGHAAEHALRIAFSARSLRLLRLVGRSRRLSAIIARVIRLLPDLAGVFGALLATTFVYAQLGVALFGGRLTVDAWPQTGRPAGDLYVYSNFNDLGSAVVTLFELLVVNNWQVIMGNTAALVGQWARAYFITWWILSVLVFTNLIVAFVVDSFFVEHAAPANVGTERQTASSIEPLETRGGVQATRNGVATSGSICDGAAGDMVTDADCGQTAGRHSTPSIVGT